MYLHNVFFHMSLVISVIIKAPLSHFLRWGQKRFKETNEARRQAAKKGQTYLGSTFLSDFVNHKCREITSEIDGLLGDGGLFPGKYAEVWSLLPAECVRSEVLLLIVTLVLTEAATWDFRFVGQVTRLHLQLVCCVETLPWKRDERRISVAHRILHTPT